MTDIAIRVQNLTKLYRIGAKEHAPRTLGQTARSLVTAPFDYLRRMSRPPTEEETLWALRDVSFDVQPGEVVGIIGRNGAGKSTLLKILSRITEPTSGRAEIHGRIASLLEVGTGFHPELTGRENIYLNGAILGMHRAEIDRKFDEIVAFAEIERFLDTPVKRYSSGMYVRLAFAVAAHLEPEILLVDEVLAVGDAAFQKKCLGKMGDVAKEGRTVLFVSHNMGAIAQLCPRSVLLQNGHMKSTDRSDLIIRRYLEGGSAGVSDVELNPQANPNAPVVATRCWIANEEGVLVREVDLTNPFCIGIRILVRRPVADVEISARVYNSLGQPLFTSNMSSSGTSGAQLHSGEHTLIVRIPSHFLAPDLYSLSVGIHRPGIEIIDDHENLLAFRVQESGSRMWQYINRGYGNILVHFSWNLFP